MDIVVTERNYKIGMRVRRGKDWRWGDQDCDSSGNRSIGTIIEDDFLVGWVMVRWDNSAMRRENSYRIGSEGHFELYMENPENKQFELFA